MLYGTKNPHGGDVYGEDIVLDFSSNVNPLGTPPNVLSAISRAALHVRQYPDPYCRALRKAIAAHEQVPEAFLLCGAGAAELIYAYCDALRPKKAMELAPTFSEYSAAASHFGAGIVRASLQAPDFLPDEKILGKLQSQAPDVLFLCTPNNPTGQTIGRPLLRSVLDLSLAQGTRVLLDECFLDFTDEKSAKDLLRRYENLLILKAFTKSYALAGLRVGYCLTGDARLLAQMAACTQPWNVSLPAQEAAAAALQDPDWVKRARSLVSEQREYLTGALSALGLTVCPSKANYLLFRAPVGLDEALRREKIAIRNCENYAGLCPGWYRIAVRLAEENKALVNAIRRALEDLSWH